MCTLCRTLFCGNHRCEEVCHSWVCHPCPLLPENVRVCPCGKVPMSKLLPPGEERTSCLDPVPTCDNTCGRLLPCSTQGTYKARVHGACVHGVQRSAKSNSCLWALSFTDNKHVCEELCHHGDCPKCPKDSTIKCRCGKSSKVRKCMLGHPAAHLL